MGLLLSCSFDCFYRVPFIVLFAEQFRLPAVVFCFIQIWFLFFKYFWNILFFANLDSAKN